MGGPTYGTPDVKGNEEETPPVKPAPKPEEATDAEQIEAE